MNVNIQINDFEIAKAIAHTRHFKEAVEGVVEDMDLNDLLDAPSRSDVEIIVEEVLEDLGISRTPQVPLQTQARIEALERQVLRLEGTLARVADVLLGKPVERIVSAAINSTED